MIAGSARRVGQIDARLVDFGGLVIERPRQNAGGGRLADTAHAGQHPGLGDAAGGKGVGQRADHRLLADQVGEILRAVLARQNTVGRLLCSGACMQPDLPVGAGCVIHDLCAALVLSRPMAIQRECSSRSNPS
jgi:hypothetical protein